MSHGAKVLMDLPLALLLTTNKELVLQNGKSPSSKLCIKSRKIDLFSRVIEETKLLDFFPV